MGLFGKGMYYENDICLKNYRELHEAMNCFCKALELEEFGASKSKISKALKLEKFGAGKSKDFELNLKFNEICFYKRPVGLDRYKEALEYHEKILRIDPNDALAWYNRGLALKNLGKLQEALKSFDKALEINSDDAEVWYNKGDTLIDIYFLKRSIRANYY